MRRLKTALAALGLWIGLCSGASAQSVVVETWHGSTMDSQNTYSSGASFTIPLASNTDRINMYSTGGLASIGTISFSGSTSASLVDVIVGSGALNTDQDADLSDSAQNWGGVSFPFSARLSGAIAGNLTGAINPDSIVRLEVHGQVSAAISCGATSGTAIAYLQLGSTSSSGVIDAGDGDIGAIEAESTGTAIAGSILALSGRIDLITTDGDIDVPAGGTA